MAHYFGMFQLLKYFGNSTNFISHTISILLKNTGCDCGNINAAIEFPLVTVVFYFSFQYKDFLYHLNGTEGEKQRQTIFVM